MNCVVEILVPHTTRLNLATLFFNNNYTNTVYLLAMKQIQSCSPIEFASWIDMKNNILRIYTRYSKGLC